MLRLPNEENATLRRLMSNRILALTEFHMNKDGSLAEGEEIALFPEGTSYDQANYEFQSLRKLLAHEKAYTPELLGEYLMYSLVRSAIDMEEDNPGNPDLCLANKRFPEPERKVLVKELGEREVKRYENLRNYDSTLFYDADYLMLDTYSESTLLEGLANEVLGIGPANGMVLDLDGKKVVVTQRPWEES